MPRKKTSPALLPRSDMGNAELFAAFFRDRLRFDHARQRWLLYREHWWQVDVDGELMRLAKHAVRFRLRQAANISDDDKRKREGEWALASESRPHLESMLTLARSEKPLADDGGRWDVDGWLLGVANGVVELKTGVLRAGVPNDRITLHSDLPFDSLAECPRWLRFLDEIFDGNTELIPYVHRAVGYSLTGQTSEQCFFCCYGEGANGKSVFIKALGHVLGTYACNLPFSAFELNARSAISNDVATLQGKRFVTAIETDESARLNEARIKALTGCDTITARLLYREYFSFKPVAKFWLAFNHPPIVADDSHGFWRRVHLIPFPRQFNPQADPKLEETLRAEASGILAWAVRGCLLWQAQGLNPPSIVQIATQDYRVESDPLRDFLEDRCLRHQAAHVTVAALREAYVMWARQNAEPNIFKRGEFSRRLEAMGFEKVRVGHGRVWTWVGICLREDADWLNMRIASEPSASEGNADVRAAADVNLQ